jgi:hypothetical protein
MTKFVKVFEGEELAATRQPLVYIAQQGTTVTYVGASRLGLSRVFQKDAKLQSRNIALADADSLTIVAFDTEKEAYDHEAELIHLHHPVGNTVCLRCKHSNPKRSRYQERRSSVDSGDRVKILKATVMHMVKFGVDQQVVNTVIQLL